MGRPWARGGWLAWAALLISLSAAAFLLPAKARTGSLWPTPLDDAYIYFGHARSWALGHPFAWYPGNGYSSGATSVVYPLLLAPLWAAGLKGSSLVLGATLLAWLFALDLARSLRRLCRSPLAGFVAPALIVAVPLVGWSWWSSMETALFGALLGRALVQASRATRLPPTSRRGAQRRAGLWLALLVLTRPEALPAAASLAVAVVYHARSLATAPSLRRLGGPAALALAAQAIANRVMTGEWSQAGAVRKLIWSSPFVDPERGVARVVENLVVLVSQAFLRALGGAGGVTALGLAIVLALSARRRLALPLVLGSAGAIALVAQNATARFQNFRYAAPALIMLLVTAVLGVDALARGRRRTWRGAAVVVAALLVLAPLRELSGQRRHFALASQNIAQQQGVVAERLAALEPRRVLVNDAGAIPYLSETPPLDGLGLGGYRGLPFARASVHSTLAVVELVERLAPDERPEVMALYPGWWPEVTASFGTPLETVRIAQNVICAAEEKVIFAADWSTLAPAAGAAPGEIDRLDVADLVSEREHGYRVPYPRSGQVLAKTLELPGGALRWDAGRRLAEGATASFRLADHVGPGPGVITLRRDDEPGRPRLRVTLRREGQVIASHWARVPPPSPGRWRSLAVPLDDLQGGDRIEITAQGGDWRSYDLLLSRFGHSFAPAR